MCDLTAKTGSAQLSCGHQFHLGCIGRWILKTETCPMCRHEMGDHEKIAEDEASASDDEDFYESEDEQQSSLLIIPKFDAESFALRVMRDTFEKVEAGEPYMGTMNEKPSMRTYIDAQGRETKLNQNSHLWRCGGAFVDGYGSA